MRGNIGQGTRATAIQRRPRRARIQTAINVRTAEVGKGRIGDVLVGGIERHRRDITEPGLRAGPVRRGVARQANGRACDESIARTS